MNETHKGHNRRSRHGHYDTWLRGNGIDIGCGPAPLVAPYATVERFDKEHGDAQTMKDVPEGKYDFVYSSHCLEHMAKVSEAIHHWLRILKPGGILYVIVPDYELYEHGRWPSAHNADHKASFSMNVIVPRPKHQFFTAGDFGKMLYNENARLLLAELQDDGFDYSPEKKDTDQTLGDAMAQILFVARKNATAAAEAA